MVLRFAGRPLFLTGPRTRAGDSRMDEVAPMPEEPPPQLACALAIAGGVLLLVQGLVLGTQSGDLFGQDAVYGNPLSEHLEAWSFLLGIIILGLATAL